MAQVPPFNPLNPQADFYTWLRYYSTDNPSTGGHAPLTLYVCQDGGSDSYPSSSSPSTAAATWTHAKSQIPACVVDPVNVVDICGGTYTGFTLIRPTQCAGMSGDGGMGYVNLQGYTPPITYSDGGLATGTSTGGICTMPNQCTFSDSTQPWADGGMTGYRLDLGNGQIYQIVGSASGTLTVAAGLTHGLYANVSFGQSLYPVAGFDSGVPYSIETWETDISNEVTLPPNSFYPVPRPTTLLNENILLETNDAGIIISDPGGVVPPVQVIVQGFEFTSPNVAVHVSGGNVTLEGNSYSSNAFVYVDGSAQSVSEFANQMIPPTTNGKTGYMLALDQNGTLGVFQHFGNVALTGVTSGGVVAMPNINYLNLGHIDRVMGGWDDLWTSTASWVMSDFGAWADIGDSWGSNGTFVTRWLTTSNTQGATAQSVGGNAALSNLTLMTDVPGSALTHVVDVNGDKLQWDAAETANTFYNSSCTSYDPRLGVADGGGCNCNNFFRLGYGGQVALTRGTSADAGSYCGTTGPTAPAGTIAGFVGTVVAPTVTQNLIQSMPAGQQYFCDMQQGCIVLGGQ